MALLFVAVALTSTAYAYQDTLRPEFVLSGATMTEQECNGVPETVWAVITGKGDCIRYYSAGLKEERNETVIIYFHGDRLERHHGRDYALTTGHTVIGYGDNAPEKLRRAMQSLSSRHHVPAIFIGRPGVYGSSGDHKARRSDREVNLMASALQKIKERHNIGKFVLAGQSGGGHITAAMITRRRDVACAVITSGSTALRARMEMNSRPVDVTGQKIFYDPIDHVAEIPKDTGLRIFVAGDPRDKGVPFVLQQKYFETLKRQKLEAYLLQGRASDPLFHGLAPMGQEMAGLCAEGRPSEEIIQRMKKD